MDLDNVFTDTRWDILSKLSKEKKSPTELSKNTETSVANISSQLKLLEALSLVKKDKSKSVGAGRPRIEYSLNNEFAYIVLNTKEVSGKKFFKLNMLQRVILLIWFIHDSTVHPYLQKFVFDYAKILKLSRGVGYVEKVDNVINVIVVGDDDNMISGFSDIVYQFEGVEKSIKVNTFSSDNFLSMVASKDEYIISILRKVHILYDPYNVLYEAKTKKI